MLQKQQKLVDLEEKSAKAGKFWNWAGSIKRAVLIVIVKLSNDKDLIRASRLENYELFSLRACSHNRNTRVWDASRRDQIDNSHQLYILK